MACQVGLQESRKMGKDSLQMPGLEETATFTNDYSIQGPIQVTPLY